MVSTARSVAYTALALPSFFRHTPLGPGDEVVLIVNDPGGRPDLHTSGIDQARLEVVENPAPLSFAANANAALRRAGLRGCGLVFMNNDIVFTPGWLGPVVAADDAITLPTCNQQRQYARGGLDLTFLMSLADFGGREAALEAAARDHTAAEAGTPWHRALIMPFFCVHVPRAVHEAVGPFDEGFGSGGGEDVDYRLRALLAGFDVRYANASYVLHFMGQSTWRSGEPAAETAARDVDYRRRFAEKWGEPLRALLLTGGDPGATARGLGVETLVRDADLLSLARRLRPGAAEDARAGPGRARLCLNMIVKNETAILERCLRSVADHVAAWVIGDTGSTDGTPELVERFFAERGIPGELHRFPFENFGQARNEALARARRSPLGYDYLLLVDADMELVVENPAFRDGLAAPAYRLVQRAGISYRNTRLLARHVPSQYRGVTHEYVDLPGGGGEDLDGAWFRDHASGSNRADKFERDIRLLLDGLAAAPDAARYLFYLAQSYRDAGRFEEAARAYAQRAALGGWDEEVWYAMLGEARCLRSLGRDAEFIGKALAAWEKRPHRIEPLRDVANHYRIRGMNRLAVTVAEPGLDVPYPKEDLLFIEDDAYNGGLKEDYAISANYSPVPAQKAVGRRLCDELSLSPQVPRERRDTARRNLAFYARPLAELVEGVRFYRLEPALEPGWAAMNPSVAAWRGALWVIQRTVNFELGGGTYPTFDGGPVRTRNFLARLDARFAIASWAEILPPSGQPAPLFPPVQGFEDMRLIPLGGALWCSSTVREMNAEGWCEQVLARIDGAGGRDPCRLADLRRISATPPRRHEKNWTPQVVGGELRFIYGYEGSVVVSREGAEVARRGGGPAVDHLRGGSQAVPFAGGWLALCHEVAMLGARRCYMHRIAWFNADTALSHVSEPFKFGSEDVEFVAGLASTLDGRNLVASYGAADRESWLAVMPIAEVRRLLGLQV